MHYEPWELRLFENIEGRWPMFFCYLIIQSIFMDDKIKALEYAKNLDDVMVKVDGIKLVPELYTVRAEDSEKEACEPGSQVKKINLNPFNYLRPFHDLSICF